MVLKALILVAAGGAVSLGVLVLRQQRLEAVHEMTRSLERADEAERLAWHLRAQVARAVIPVNVARMAARLGPMKPIPREVCPTTPGLDPPKPRRRSLTSAAGARGAATAAD